MRSFLRATPFDVVELAVYNKEADKFDIAAVKRIAHCFANQSAQSVGRLSVVSASGTNATKHKSLQSGSGQLVHLLQYCSARLTLSLC